jgi:3alpha(or 20beta)-hydroxysteroid dehydrogenase
MGRLAGKVAIVTGGARGMGGATSELFAAEGARVVIADVLPEQGEELARKIGTAAVFAKLDVSDEANWQSVVRDTIARWGQIDVLVNNAGTIAVSTIVDMPLADFERVIRVNLIGTFLGIKTVAPGMIARKRGSIVNISSVDGLRGVNGLSAYSSSKWGLRGLTRNAALELGPQGVRVNSIHPGGVNTMMGNPRSLPAAEMNLSYTRVPLQRVGEPEEIARASLFLASDDASYVCGAELSVDGGWAAGFYHESLPGVPNS